MMNHADPTVADELDERPNEQIVAEDLVEEIPIDSGPSGSAK
jgi:hypothetical protein